ncbi:MAG: DNA ligase-associated DEXH box helicase, partial [Bacteroidota bacterium]
WWRSNAEQDVASLITAYSLGKAQRILQGVDASIGPIYTHGAVENTNEVLRQHGLNLQASTQIRRETTKADLRKALIIAPPSAANSNWVKRFMPFSLGMASGWMQLRGARRRRAADRGFVLSDHADWDGLNEAVFATGAEQVFVTHGYSEIYSRYLREQGLDAKVVQTEFEGEVLEGAEKNQDQPTND